MMRAKKRVHMLIAALLPLLAANAESLGDWSENQSNNPSTVDPVSTKRPVALVRALRWVGTFIDSMSVNGVDRRYIDAPKEPWQVIVKGNVNQSDLKLESRVTSKSLGLDDDVSQYIEWEPRIKTRPSTYAGVWVGYRGYGLGYSWNLGGDKGNLLTAGAMGGSFGINLRIHNFESDNPMVKYAMSYNDEDDPSADPVEDYGKNEFLLLSPIKIRTLTLDGYYMFNGKHFSYAAAYDQSVIQKRSAGSLMAGFMYYHNNIQYANDINANFIVLMNSMGRIKQSQLSVGAGYAYNLVPCRGLLVSAMFMPMLTFYNNNKVSYYGSNYKDYLMDDDQTEEPDMWDWRIRPEQETSENGGVSFNIDARLSLTYNWKRFFANVYGQFCRFPYKDEHVKGRLYDWYVNAALGFRL